MQPLIVDKSQQATIKRLSRRLNIELDDIFSLLIAEGFDRVESRSFVSRIETKCDSYACRNDHGGDDCPNGNRRWPVQRNRDDVRSPASQKNPNSSAKQAQHHGFGQKLPHDVARLGPYRHAQTNLRVLSVTDTSMIFIIPMPPTSSEIIATHSSSLVIISAVELMVFVISVMSRM